MEQDGTTSTAATYVVQYFLCYLISRDVKVLEYPRQLILVEVEEEASDLEFGWRNCVPSVNVQQLEDRMRMTIHELFFKLVLFQQKRLKHNKTE